MEEIPDAEEVLDGENLEEEGREEVQDAEAPEAHEAAHVGDHADQVEDQTGAAHEAEVHVEGREEGEFRDKAHRGGILVEEVPGEETLGVECPEEECHCEAVPGVVALGSVFLGEGVLDAASALDKAVLGAEVPGEALGEDPDGVPDEEGLEDRVHGVLEVLCEVRVGVEGHA